MSISGEKDCLAWVGWLVGWAVRMRGSVGSGDPDKVSRVVVVPRPWGADKGLLGVTAEMGSWE